jgi:TolB protein
MKKILALLLILLNTAQAFAIERIDITQGNIDPTPVANVSFLGNDPVAKEVGKEIIAVINNDLQGTGLFRVIDDSAYIEPIKDLSHIPNFSAWRQINASALLVGKVNNIGGGQVNVEYHLWDPYSERSLKRNSYQGKESQWRRIAHKIADDIYKRLTGEEGYFNTKIVFIAESGPAKNRIKKLTIMDQDGANLKYLSDGRNLTLTPRFSPDSHKILYLAYIKHKAKVHIRDLNTGQDKILGHFKGMTFAPRFSPDGREAVMSASANGSSDVVLLDLATMKSSKLTSGAYINTSPYFAPDGNKIVFISDRSGTSKLYVMNKDGGDQQRISFGDGSYFTPIWSPRGDYIAFTRKYQGVFYIGVMRPDGSGERMLTQGYLVGNPTWAPNGRVIMYTKTDRYTSGGNTKSTLCTVDLTGHFERTLKLPTDASDAGWSNPLN